ncbi:MAG: hypothetical protein G01um10145_179 [Microgenomates group bacterium Gr01-1014_5]|nr:MAG: hypothetical protein G01um10145_179 [Microgenomates group bacterium Gr01-1014_5]
MEIKKLKLLDVGKVEKYLARWIYTKRYRLITFSFIILLLLSSFFVPYLNLIVTSYLLIFLAFVLAPFVLDIDAKIFIVTGITLFFLTFIVWSLGQTEEAESIANYVYIILLSGSLKALLS